MLHDNEILEKPVERIIEGKFVAFLVWGRWIIGKVIKVSPTSYLVRVLQGPEVFDLLIPIRSITFAFLDDTAGDPDEFIKRAWTFRKAFATDQENKNDFGRHWVKENEQYLDIQFRP